MQGKEGRGHCPDDAECKVGECFATIRQARLGEGREKLRRGLGFLTLAGGVRLVAEPDLVARVQVVEQDVSAAVATDLHAARSAPEDRRIVCQVHISLLRFVPDGVMMNL